MLGEPVQYLRAEGEVLQLGCDIGCRVGRAEQVPWRVAVENENWSTKNRIGFVIERTMVGLSAGGECQAHTMELRGPWYGLTGTLNAMSSSSNSSSGRILALARTCKLMQNIPDRFAMWLKLGAGRVIRLSVRPAGPTCESQHVRSR